MAPLPIAHIGILVADVETARRNWTNALGAPFSPIVRYRSAAWSGIADPVPHANDLRQTIYIGVDPSIEIQEFVNNGSHASSRGEGGHHLSFPPVSDNNARQRELAELGIEMDGGANYKGRWIIQFSDARALNNVSTEWVEESPGHLDLKDDGSPVDRLPDGSATVFDPETMLALDGHRPPSGIVEFGVLVADLDKAVETWSAVTGYAFDTDGDRTAVSRGAAPAVRLVEAGQTPAREGLYYAVVKTQSIEQTLERLRRAGVPLAGEVSAVSGRVDVEPTYLNGFSLRFVAGRD
jgi:catechol 2,3-dioxygenase-like lactoylglutathione lyase family enzyme